MKRTLTILAGIVLALSPFIVLFTYVAILKGWRPVLISLGIVAAIVVISSLGTHLFFKGLDS